MNDIKLKKMEPGFVQEVSRRSGQNFSGCFHCMCCSGGCPVAEDMDYLPNALFRMVQLGMKKEVLESRTIWLCVGCYGCVAECPNGIHIPSMMDTLRQMALEEKATVGEPDVLSFHSEFMKQVEKRGRLYEIGFMARYKMRSKSLFRDIKPGLKMLLTGRLEFLPGKIRKINEIKRLGCISDV